LNFPRIKNTNLVAQYEGRPSLRLVKGGETISYEALKEVSTRAVFQAASFEKTKQEKYQIYSVREAQPETGGEDDQWNWRPGSNARG